MDLRQALGAVERLVLQDEIERAADLYVTLDGQRPLREIPIFEGVLARDPESHGHHWLRAALEWCVGLADEARCDLVRALLVSPGEDFLVRSRPRVLEALEGHAPVTSWLFHALAAVLARLDGSADDERHELRAALRLAPGETALHVSLARLEQGTCSLLEIVSLEQALERAPGWTDGRLRLLRAYLSLGETVLAETVLLELRHLRSFNGPRDAAA
jgi:hypothetical protein